MKKTLFSIAVFTALSSTSIYAYANHVMDMKGEVSPALMPAVTIPMYQGHFMLAGEGDYNLVMGAPTIASYDSATTGNYVSTIMRNRQSSKWGYRIYAGYTFANSGNDIEAIWQDFSTSHTVNASTPNNTTTFYGTQFLNNGTAATTTVPITDITHTVSYNYQYLDFVAGQHFDYGCLVNMRLFGGLRYIRLKQAIDASGSANDFIIAGAPRDTVQNFSSNSTYKGLGLRGGLDGEYKFGYGFSATSTFGMSLLAVSLTSGSTASNSRSGVTVLLNNQTNVFPTQLQIAPEMDGRVGLKYSYVYGDSNESAVSIEGGYHIESYFTSLGSFAMRGPYVKAEVDL